MIGRILPYGDRALMLELDSLDEVLAVHWELVESAPAGVIDIVPAARTVTVTLDPALLPLSVARVWLARAGHPHDDAHFPIAQNAPNSPAVRRVIGNWADAEADTVLPIAQNAPDLRAARRVIGNWEDAARADAVVLDVDYSGPDLPEVARLLGWSVAEVIAWHSGCRWRVAFCGFSPGFGYLVPDREDGGIASGAAADGVAAGRVRVPRRQSPRTSVPAGSVALADEFSGVYPRRSPGGWQLIGSTDAVLWDASRESPALLSPGREVRFRLTAQGGG